MPDAQAKGLKPLRIPQNIFEKLVMSAFPSVDKLSRLKWSIIDHKLSESAYRNRDSIVMKTLKSRSFFGNDKLELINVGLVCSNSNIKECNTFNILYTKYKLHLHRNIAVINE